MANNILQEERKTVTHIYPIHYGMRGCLTLICGCMEDMLDIEVTLEEIGVIKNCKNLVCNECVK